MLKTNKYLSKTELLLSNKKIKGKVHQPGDTLLLQWQFPISQVFVLLMGCDGGLPVSSQILEWNFSRKQACRPT